MTTPAKDFPPRMTAERIAEIRADLPKRGSETEWCGGQYINETMAELLDALQAAYAEADGNRTAAIGLADAGGQIMARAAEDCIALRARVAELEELGRWLTEHLDYGCVPQGDVELRVQVAAMAYRAHVEDSQVIETLHNTCRGYERRIANLQACMAER